MFMLLIGHLCSYGFKYHYRRSKRFPNTHKKFAYHVYMGKLYTEIVRITLQSGELERRYSRKDDDQ